MRYGWKLDKNSWSRLSAAIGSRTWKTVPFSLLEKKEVPEKCGVYVFCARPIPGKPSATNRNLLQFLYNAIYAGQATNLRQRFDNHWRDPMDPMHRLRACFSATLEFWYITFESSVELSKVECLLIDCLGPTANRNLGPTVKGLVGDGRPA